jgi:hypothetical protein
MMENNFKVTKTSQKHSIRVSQDLSVCRLQIDRYGDEQWLFKIDDFRLLLWHGVINVYTIEMFTRRTLPINLILIVFTLNIFKK